MQIESFSPMVLSGGVKSFTLIQGEFYQKLKTAISQRKPGEAVEVGLANGEPWERMRDLRAVVEYMVYEEKSIREFAIGVDFMLLLKVGDKDHVSTPVNSEWMSIARPGPRITKIESAPTPVAPSTGGLTPVQMQLVASLQGLLIEESFVVDPNQVKGSLEPRRDLEAALKFLKSEKVIVDYKVEGGKFNVTVPKREDRLYDWICKELARCKLEGKPYFDPGEGKTPIPDTLKLGAVLEGIGRKAVDAGVAYGWHYGREWGSFKLSEGKDDAVHTAMLNEGRYRWYTRPSPLEKAPLVPIDATTQASLDKARAEIAKHRDDGKTFVLDTRALGTHSFTVAKNILLHLLYVDKSIHDFVKVGDESFQVKIKETDTVDRPMTSWIRQYYQPPEKS